MIRRGGMSRGIGMVRAGLSMSVRAGQHLWIHKWIGSDCRSNRVGLVIRRGGMSCVIGMVLRGLSMSVPAGKHLWMRWVMAVDNELIRVSFAVAVRSCRVVRHRRCYIACHGSRYVEPLSGEVPMTTVRLPTSAGRAAVRLLLAALPAAGGSRPLMG